MPKRRSILRLTAGSIFLKQCNFTSVIDLRENNANCCDIKNNSRKKKRRKKKRRRKGSSKL